MKLTVSKLKLKTLIQMIDAEAFSVKSECDTKFHRLRFRLFINHFILFFDFLIHFKF
jgi:hypothetical protein